MKIIIQFIHNMKQKQTDSPVGRKSSSSLAFHSAEISNLSSQEINQSVQEVSIPKLQAKINKSEHHFGDAASVLVQALLQEDPRMHNSRAHQLLLRCEPGLTQVQSLEVLGQDQLDELIPKFTSLKHVLAQRYSLIKKQDQLGAQELMRTLSASTRFDRDLFEQQKLEALAHAESPEKKRAPLSRWQKTKRCTLRGLYRALGKEVPPELVEEVDQEEEELKAEREKQKLQELSNIYCRTSLNKFDLNSPYRRVCIDLMNSVWFDKVIIFLIALNSLLLGILDYKWDGTTPTPLINQIAEETEIVFTVAFTIEAIIKISAMGFIFGSRCYLRDAWNWLDFMVVLTSLAQKLPFMQNMSILRTFRLFRPLKTLTAVPSMKLLIGTLFSSVQQVSNILVLNFYFILIFAIFGLHMWQGVAHYRCRQTKYPVDGDWKVVEGDSRVCGSFHQCEIACGSLYELYLPNEEGVMTQYKIDPKIDLSRDQHEIANHYGFSNFDSIQAAFLAIFQCTTRDGWVGIMHLIQDSFNVYISAVFFVLCIVICSYVLLNLSVAVMLEKFKRLRSNRKKQMEKQQSSIDEQNEIIRNIQSKIHQRTLRSIVSLHNRITLSQKLKMLWRKAIWKGLTEAPSVEEAQRYSYKVCRICWHVNQVPFFNTVTMAFILLNTVILATDRFPSPENDLIKQSSQFFTVFFALECAIKLIGLTFIEWRQDTFNIFDLFIVTMSCLEVLISENDVTFISAFRSLRLLRLFRLARSNLTLRCLLDSIGMTIYQCLNFIVIMSIFLYTFALLGMEMFAGKFKFDEFGRYDLVNGKVPRQNYDEISWAVLTVFQVFVGDQWTVVMYMAYQTNNKLAVLYFIVLVLISRIVLLNLFLAVLLGYFEAASTSIREQHEKFLLAEFESSLKMLQEDGQQDKPKSNQVLPMGIFALSKRDSSDDKFRMKLQPVLSQVKGGDSPSKSPGSALGEQLQRRMAQSIFGGSFSMMSQKTEGGNEQDKSPKDSSYDSSINLRAEHYREEQREKLAQVSHLRIESPPVIELMKSKLKQVQNAANDLENLDTEQALQSNRGLLAKVSARGSSGSPQSSRLHSNLKVSTGAQSPNLYKGDSSPGTAGSFKLEASDFWTYMSESSLFTFHKDQCLRKFMIKLTLSGNLKKKPEKKSADIILNMIKQKELESFEEDDGDDNLKTETSKKDGLCPIQFSLQQTIAQQTIEATVNAKGFDLSIKKKQRAGTPYPRLTDSEKSSKVDNSVNSLMTSYDGEEMLRMKHSRIWCLNWTLNGWFENVVYFFIVLSMLILIVDNPQNDPDSFLSRNVRTFDILVAVLFSFEASCRIIAEGFFTSSLESRRGYIRSGSNQIDFFVCISCDIIAIYENYATIGIGLDRRTINSFKVLRSIRALRFLRVISKNQGLKVAVGSLFRALPAIINGMVVCFLVIFIYAIIAISIFKGQFFHCLFPGMTPLESEQMLKNVVTKQDCIDQGGSWTKSERNFDDIFSALGVLFEIVNAEGWLQLLYQGLDVAGIDMQPKKNNSPLSSLYFISFIIIGHIFLQNLFVGIVIDKFSRIKDRMKGYQTMTQHQREWVEAEKSMIQLKLKRAQKEIPNQNWVRQLSFRVQESKYFGIIIQVSIFMSVILMSLYFYQMPPLYEKIITDVSYVLAAVYNVEAIIKIVAFEKQYFKESWNCLDFFICCSSNLGMFLNLFTTDGKRDSLKVISQVLIALRILRVFRLVRLSQSLRKLMDSLALILPSIANIGSLILLMLFIFAIIGVNMFSNVIHQKELNENTNFSDFGSALVTLIRCATGEKWNDLMRELAVTNETLVSQGEGKTCQLEQTYSDRMLHGPQNCGNDLAYLYFTFFMVVIHTMMLNLFIAVVLEGYMATLKDHIGIVSTEMLDDLVDTWVDYDPEATGWISVKDLIFLVYDVREPLGKRTLFETEVKEQIKLKLEFIKIKNKSMVNRFVVHEARNMVVPYNFALEVLKQLELPVYSQSFGDYFCHFRDVCKKLVMLALQQQVAGFDAKGIARQYLKQLDHQWKRKYSDLKSRTLLPTAPAGQTVKFMDTGKLWAGQYIVNCVENMHHIRKYYRQEFVLEQDNLTYAKQDDDQGSPGSPFKQRSKKFRPGSKDAPRAPVEGESKADKALADQISSALNQELEYKERLGAETSASANMQARGEAISNVKRQLMNLYKMKLQRSQGKAPVNLRDTERSTWWMADDLQSKKMRQWVDNQDFKHEMRKNMR